MTEGANSALTKRDLSIDKLKVVAIFGVIIIHVCAYNYNIASFNWTASVFWGSIVRASVPIFFMCSGALLLRPGKAFSVRRFYRKNILRIIAAMLVWAMAYKMFHLAAGHNLTAASLFQALKEVLLFNQEFHLYYLQIILLVYLFVPVMRIITQNASKRELEYLLILWLAFGIIFPTVLPYWPFRLLTDIPMQYKMNMTYAAIGYSLLGFYLKRYPLRRRVWYFILAAAGFLIVFGGTYLSSMGKEALDEHFFEGMSVGVCLLAAGIFGIFVSAEYPRNEKFGKTAIYFSKASFCIFLSHVFFLDLLSDLGVTADILPTAISTPILAGIIFACSTLVYAVLSRIPVVKDWII